MKYRKLHWLEKVQVQLATLGGVVVVYLFFASLFRPVDPYLPIVFLPTGNYARIAVLAVLLWVLAGVCAIATLTSRPEGSLVAALFAVGGVSLRSTSLITLLWTKQGEFGGLFRKFVIETIILFGLLVGAIIIIALVRQLGRKIVPAVMWRDPLVEFADQHARSQEEPGYLLHGWLKHDSVGLITLLMIYLQGRKNASKADIARAGEALRGLMVCFAASLLFTVILVVLLMRSEARGQVIFAVVAGSFMAVLIAHQLFPTPFSVVAWLTPLVVGIILYSVSAYTSSSVQPVDVPLYANALPIDWLTAGGGGGMLGFWVSSRIFEARHFEKIEALNQA